MRSLLLATSVLCSPNDAAVAHHPEHQEEHPVHGKHAEHIVSRLQREHVKMEDELFSFRKKKDEVTGEETKRPSFKLKLPIPTIDGIVEALGNAEYGAKVGELLVSLVRDEVKSQARVQVDDETKPVNEQKDLDLSTLTLEYIASLPPKERGGQKIAEEAWTAFRQDYMAIMPGVMGKDANVVENGLKLFEKKYNPCKTDKKVLGRLKEFLNLYVTHTKSEEVVPVVEYLSERVETLLNAEAPNLLETLG